MPKCLKLHKLSLLSTDSQLLSSVLPRALEQKVAHLITPGLSLHGCSCPATEKTRYAAEANDLKSWPRSALCSTAFCTPSTLGFFFQGHQLLRQPLGC